MSSLIHYTDWVPGHVHMGTMGWVTLTAAASMYFVIPRIYDTEIYSEPIANVHVWLVLIGQLIFSVTMWITGIQQGALWKATNPDGTLQYSFVETLARNYPYYQMRTLGAVIFTVGMLFFIFNIFMTVRQGKNQSAIQA